MTVGRIKSFPYPERVDSLPDIQEYLKRLHRSLTEEQVERITDTENMVIDSQEVGNLTIVTSFKPTVDNAVDIGVTTYRFKDLYLSGSLKDDTVTLTVAHAKDAYDKRVDTWGNGLEYSAQTAAVDYNTTNLKITSTELDTIQSIATNATPTFGACTLGTGTTIGTLTLADGSITDSGGAISFGNENLSTTGTFVVNNNFAVNASIVSTMQARIVGSTMTSAGTTYGLFVNPYTRAVTANETNYIIAISGTSLTANIAEGVTDSGYRMGMDFSCGITDANFIGTLGSQTGQRIQHGLYSNATGTINATYGLKITSFARVGTTDALYQLYMSADLSGGVPSTAYGIYQGHASLKNYFAGNVGMGQTTFGTNAATVFAQATGVAPTTSPADCFQMYSADIGAVAGKSGVHFRDEEGNVISLGSGGIIMSGTARIKSQIPIDNANLGKGATAPTQVIIGNYNGWEYTINDDTVFTFHLPHDWASGTNVVINIDWYINEAGGDEIKWRIDWAATPHDASEAIDAPTHTGNSDTGDIVVPATVKYLTQDNLTIAGASLSAGDQVGVKLSRVAITDGTDPGNDPAVVDIHIEYTADKLGEAT